MRRSLLTYTWEGDGETVVLLYRPLLPSESPEVRRRFLGALQKEDDERVDLMHRAAVETTLELLVDVQGASVQLTDGHLVAFGCRMSEADRDRICADAGIAPGKSWQEVFGAYYQTALLELALKELPRYIAGGGLTEEKKSA